MGQRTAVVVGINYDKFPRGINAKQRQRAGLQRLSYAEDDAAEMAEALRQAGYDVQVLLGPAATRAAILDTITKQRIVAGRDGLLLFHFSGHGDAEDDTAYLLPVDADPTRLNINGISYHELLETALSSKKIERAVALIDCCHSGHAAGMRGGAIPADPAFLADAQKSYSRGRVVLTACAGSQVAWELSELEHGAFTYYALQEFRENRGQVDIESLFGRLDRGLRKHEQLHPPVRGGSHQGTIVLRDAQVPNPQDARPAVASVAASPQEAPAPALRKRYKDYLYARYERADLRGTVREEHAGLHANPPRLQAIYVPLRAWVVTHRPVDVNVMVEATEVRGVFGDVFGSDRDYAKGKTGPTPPASVPVDETEPNPSTLPKHVRNSLYHAPAPREHVELDPLVASAPVLVILGDPGSGKSTALKRYALELLAAEDGPLPLLVPLAAYAQDLRDEPSLSIIEFAARYYAARDAPGLQPLFDYQRGAGQLVYLLDGLDEVPGDLRGQVSDMVTALAPNLGGNRLIATSRITGYVPLALRDYQEATIERLQEDQIAAFVHNWYAAFFAGRPPLGVEARQTADRLLEIIRTNPGVAKLADNPLTLTLLALLFFAGNAELPRRRVKLYGYVARTLIADWHRARNLAGIPVGSAHDELEVLQQIGPLAYWMHDQKPEGVASRDEVAQVLARVERAARPDEDPLPRVNRFLEVLSKDVGLLAEKGAGQWGFSHQTFQEYFAAREIARRPRQMAAEIARRAPDPRWTEVIRLAIAYLGSETGATEDATELVAKTILKRKDPYERYLHRNLLLAGRVLADDPGVPLPAALPIARRLFELWRETEVTALQESTGAILRDLLSTPLRAAILGWFGEMIGAKREIWRLSMVVGEPTVQAALLPLLADPDPTVRSNTASTLRTVAGEPKVQAALLPLLAHPDPHVHGDAASALGAVAAEPKVQAALLPLLADPIPIVRRSTAGALHRVVGEPKVQTALLPLLTDPDPIVRGNTVFSLGLAVREPGVQAALLPLLADPDPNVRRNTALALHDVAGRLEVQAALLPLLGDPNPDMRGCVTSTLSLVAGEPEMRAALLPLLADPDPYVRSSTASTLQTVAGEPEMQAALLPLLADPDPNVRWSTAIALREVAGEPEVQTALLPLLTDREPDVILAAALALCETVKEPQVHTVVLSLLNTPDLYDRAKAIEALGNAPPDPATRQRLGTLLRIDNFEVRNAAFATLTRWAAIEDGLTPPPVTAQR